MKQDFTKHVREPGPFRVLMIVPNPCTSDSRVIKEARTLAAAGYKIKVLCKADGRSPALQYVDGVEYRRVSMDSWSWFWPALLFRRRAPAPGHGRPPESDGRLVSTANPEGTDAFSSSPQPAPQPQDAVLREAHAVTRRGRLNDVFDFLYETAKFAGGFAIRLFRRLKSLVWAMARAIGTTPVLPLDSIWAETCAFMPDVIHVHDLSPLPAAVSAGRLLNAAVVYDAHELETHRNGLGILARIQVSAVEGVSIRKAAAVITVCDSIARFLADKYAIAKPIVILNAPEIEAVDEAGPTVRDAIGIPPGTPLAIYVGKITFGRGLEQLVDAMPSCPEFHVALLGPRLDWVHEKLIRLARRRGVDGRLHFVESVAPGQVVAFIRSADIGVVPIQDVCLSYRYCLPNKLFEMTFAGVPACVSDLPEMRGFVEREHAGVVMDQTNPGDIAAKMRDLYRRRDEFSVAGVRRLDLIERYSWSRQAARLENLYQKLVAARNEAPAVPTAPLPDSMPVAGRK